MSPGIWSERLPIARLRTRDVAGEGSCFEHGEHWYRSTGQLLGKGGMGAAYALERCVRDRPGETEDVVGKVLQDEYLAQLRTDTITRDDHRTVMHNLSRIIELAHPHILPTYVATPIADNFLVVTPRYDTTLAAVVAEGRLSPRKRVALLMQALSALQALHDAGMVHRDFTLRNILVDRERERAALFDFDLTLHQEELAGASYKERYQGRIFGSPGYSVAPEVVDEVLMELPISHSLDVYAVGSALFSLFTDELPYGHAKDMWELLLRISEGVVLRNECRIVYSDNVPNVLRPIIETCLERNPTDRYERVSDIIDALAEVLSSLPDGRSDLSHFAATTATYGDASVADRLRIVVETRRDHSITAELIGHIDSKLLDFGYEIQRNLGIVKNRPIFLVKPAAALVASGTFHDSNTYPKIITVISLGPEPRASQVIERWLQHYLPILRSARTGLLTSIHRVEFDADRRYLFVFSEYVDRAHFGTELKEFDLSLVEALSLGYLVTLQVKQLHSHGLAHNNISDRSLILKRNASQRLVRPAMVGIVDPSLADEDVQEDVRNTANLIASWIRQTRVEAADEIARARLVDVWTRLKEQAASPESIDELVEITADGLSCIDFNFGVLREHRGDLESYALLLLSHRLYARLRSTRL